jgi:serine protease Do
MASVAGVGGALLLGGPAQFYNVKAPAFATQAQAAAQAAERTGPASFAGVVQKVKPAVISIRVKLDDESQTTGSGDPMERFFRQFGGPDLPRRHFSMAQGSGFFISADGYAVTNNHVVEHAKSVEVTTDDSKTYQAKVVGTDPKTDIALIKVEGRNDFPYVKFADGTPQVGDWVLAVGNPFGLGGTVTAGIVSARGRDIGASAYDDFIQIDAPVNKGNSGGPAFNEDGDVVGVTTAIYSPSGGSVGIGFAIPAETVKNVITQLKDSGTVTRGWMGVQIQTVTPSIADSLGLKKAEGALVAEPQNGGPAEQAGIQAGDVIQSVNGQDVKDSRDLAKKIASEKPGTDVKIGLLRDGQEKTVTVKLQKMPSEQANAGEHGNMPSENPAPLGLTLAPASRVAGAGDKGVVVVNVNPDGPAAAAGFESGDVILDVGGKAVNRPGDVRDAVQSARNSGKEHVLMRVKSGDNTRFVALPIKQG